jgi:hypothetical protein
VPGIDEERTRRAHVELETSCCFDVETFEHKLVPTAVWWAFDVADTTVLSGRVESPPGDVQLGKICEVKSIVHSYSTEINQLGTIL